MKSDKNRVSIYSAAVFVMMGVYALIIGAACHFQYIRFMYDDFDLAMHTQTLGAILRGSSYSSIIAIPFLGNHMVLILYLIAPLYKIFPSAALLLYLQTFVLASGAWAVFRLAKRELTPAWGVAMAATYLIYPPLIYMNLYEFHPIVFSTAFILYALLFWKENSFKRFMLMLVFAASCQENISLMAVGFGVFALFERKRWWWSVVPLVFGTVYFGIVVIYLLPKLNDKVGFLSIYAHLGKDMPEVITNIIIHPIHTLHLMTQPVKLNFIRSLLSPVGFLPLLSPLTWIPLGPILAQRLLSNRATEFVIAFHYQAEFIPFVFVSSIYAIRRLRNLPVRILNLIPIIIIAGMPLLAFITSGPIPRIYKIFKPQKDGMALIEAKRNFIRQVPEEAKIAATFEFLSPLASHSVLHSMHHITSGYYTLSDNPYEIPQDLDVIVIDSNDRMTFSPDSFYSPKVYLKLQQLLQTGQWEIVAHEESLLALQRSSQNDHEIPLARDVQRVPDTAGTNVMQTGTATFSLKAFEITAEPNGRFSKLNMFWKTGSEPDSDADMLLTVSAPGKETYEAILSPGNRFWPPQSWPRNTIIRDQHRIPFTGEVGSTAVSVKMLPMNRPLGL
jgi:uncharacterized membrane protein